jgi:hypothetical protein
MAIDVNALKARLAALQNPKGAKGDNQPKTLWRAAVGKHSVRILPSVYDKTNPFKEIYVYYGINNKTMMSPACYDEKDPIAEFTQKLRKSSNKEDWQLARKLEPKMRVMVPVIVRGEEDKGVMLWEFGKQVYMELIAIMEDEDVGDYTDPISGRDITIETTSPEQNGTNFNQSKVRVRTKITPLSEKEAEVKKWLTEQPNPVESYKHFSYEDMKAALQAHLNPEDEQEKPAAQAEETETTGDLPWETPTPTTPKKEAGKEPKSFSLSTKKTDTDKAIDDLFNI